ncbi:MAG TPA: membrane protein insertase YidC [Deltaproteobacteria bacterium]|nr:membrane protein insertase YidC [Deltaproteobacteria bacterium]
MDNDKRIIIAVVLSMAVLFAYPYFIETFLPAPPAPGKADGSAAVEETSVRDGEDGGVFADGRPAATAPASPTSPAVDEKLTTVETPLFSAVFTNVGGALRSWKLKGYRTALAEDAGNIELVGLAGAGATLETTLSAGGFDERIVFTPSADSIEIGADGKAQLRFTWTSPQGVTVVKTYAFSGGGYVVEGSLKVRNGSQSTLRAALATELRAGYPAENDYSYYHRGPVIYADGKVTRHAADDDTSSGRGEFEWLGVEDKYFLQALIPRTEGAVGWSMESPSTATAVSSLSLPLDLEPGEGVVYSFDAYLGPKVYDILTALDRNLVESIEFGFFSFMAKPFLVVLNFFERYIGNYGIAIILLTCIIKILFYPLTKQSLNAMREMQKIQPQLMALKEKYKDDKQKLNKELMELYKRYKINPLGGCLPMVLQIPVFIALYEVLSVAIELRHAPFILWIADLSAKDPYYITPVLMGGSMLLQQKMSPTTVDPQQAKIMLIMPVVFTFMFLNFPAGLVVYWLVNNILSIVQQYYIQRTAR